MRVQERRKTSAVRTEMILWRWVSSVLDCRGRADIAKGGRAVICTADSGSYGLLGSWMGFMRTISQRRPLLRRCNA